MSEPKTIQPRNSELILRLLPPPVAALPADHLVFFLLDLAAELDPRPSMWSTRPEIPLGSRPMSRA